VVWLVEWPAGSHVVLQERWNQTRTRLREWSPSSTPAVNVAYAIDGELLGEYTRLLVRVGDVRYQQRHP
jgi:hypothetical protein